MIDLARFQFFDRMQLWFNTNEQLRREIDQNLDNTIVLSEAFYREINEHRIPVEREVVAALAHAPGVLDFYMWLVWKSWTVNGRTAVVPITAAHGLSGQLGTVEYGDARFFRRKVTVWLRGVKALWPECPASVSGDGSAILINSSRKSPAIRPVERPVSI